jgi:alternate F1F0 ATPase F1 subunit epsilon
MTFRLELRTPKGLLVDRDVVSVRAEDLDGWFGLGAGHSDLVAALPPGLMVLRDRDGETFVALAGGVLSMRGGRCRVMCRDALIAPELSGVAEEVERRHRERRERQSSRVAVLRDLVREALKRMVGEVRG